VPPEEDAVSVKRHWQGGAFSPEAIGALSLPQKRGIMPRTPARNCGNYSPGHSPHHIQSRKSLESEWFYTRVEHQGSDLFKLTLGDGRVLVLRNHEPDRLVDYLEEYSGSFLRYSVRYRLLGIPTEDRSTAIFSLGEYPLEQC
jgi:hypothetical protein